MRPEGNQNGQRELRGYSDVYYIGDNDTKKSVTVYIIFINGVVTTWNSGSEKEVTFSVTKNEYLGTTEAYCETLFFCAILFLWKFLSNTPLLCTLITLEIYHYWRTHWYSKGRST